MTHSSAKSNSAARAQATAARKALVESRRAEIAREGTAAGTRVTVTRDVSTGEVIRTTRTSPSGVTTVTEAPKIVTKTATQTLSVQAKGGAPSPPSLTATQTPLTALKTPLFGGKGVPISYVATPTKQYASPIGPSLRDKNISLAPKAIPTQQYASPIGPSLEDKKKFSQYPAPIYKDIPQSPPLSLKETIKQVRTPWHFVAMLAEGDLNYLKNTSGQEKVSESEMLKLCECVRVIIVGAYDGEGYVFWEVK